MKPGNCVFYCEGGLFVFITYMDEGFFSTAFSELYILLTVLLKLKNDSPLGFPSRSSRSFEDSSIFCVETEGTISKFKNH